MIKYPWQLRFYKVSVINSQPPGLKTALLDVS